MLCIDPSELLVLTRFWKYYGMSSIENRSLVSGMNHRLSLRICSVAIVIIHLFAGYEEVSSRERFVAWLLLGA